MTLTDAGPLIAICDEADPNHAHCIAALPLLRPPLVTMWAVITEAMYLLGKVNGWQAQSLLWGYLDDGLLTVEHIDQDRRARTKFYMNRYSDRPCDLADGSLISLAETLSARRIFSIDRDFFFYVLEDGTTLEVIPGPRPR